MSKQEEIIVLGAGVVGLQTALTLLEAGFGVTVVAKHWPGEDSIEYCSTKAGAHWRSHAPPTDARLKGFEAETYKYWQTLCQNPDAGLRLTTSHHRLTTTPWWSTLVTSYTPHTYDSFCLDPNTYLDHLLGRLGDLGVKTHTAEVDALSEVFDLPSLEEAAAVVNCTGLAAGALCADANVYPTKGQTVLVKGEAAGITFTEGEGWTAYVIPRPGSGTSILGGSKDDGDWSAEVDAGLSARIQERCRELAPELLEEGKFVVLSEQVGRRPSRKGGVRVEVGWVKMDGIWRIVGHNYGHGGTGYQSSVGTARELCRLLKEALVSGHQ
ncbi:hypothetical protein DFP73DRAFT_559931 [Morchella snyderi]|nr:hypothetical protein DFP73DRAFT_559931 [Morchella snyderi]